MSSLNAAIGERVHRVMWTRRIPQSVIARELGLSQSAISRKLHGDRAWDADDVLAVAELLDLSLEYLFFGDGPEPEINTGSSQEAVAA